MTHGNPVSEESSSGRNGVKGGKEEEMCLWASGSFSSVHLLEELVGGVLVAVLLHLGQVALLRGDGRIHLETDRKRHKAQRLRWCRPM